MTDCSPKTPEWSSDVYALLIQEDVDEVKAVSLEDLVKKSDDFPIRFPVDTGRCKTLRNHLDKATLESHINSTYPLIHESALELCGKFLLFKTKHGSKIEKALYKGMSLKSFVDRLLKKRAVMFMGRFDSYLLIDGNKGSKNWETIGTDKERGCLRLGSCLSYDEIKLSAFLSVSSYTYFVNLGDRKNMARLDLDRTKIADEGIIAGMIGARLKKENVMEYQDIVVSKDQNTKGQTTRESICKLFHDFYEAECLDFEGCMELVKKSAGDRRFEVLENKVFDNHVYQKRLSITFDTLLLEANARAKAKNTTAYIHLVGLGLGVWKISPHQERVYVNTFAQRLRSLGPNLHNLSDVCLSYINVKSCGGSKNGETFPISGHPHSGIKIHITKRNPHQKLVGPDTGKLLVVTYAWDGNALPGNEYWSGKLGSSGDSAAASSTQITELHNPHINDMVCANNLRVITSRSVVTFAEYQENIRTAQCKRK